MGLDMYIFRQKKGNQDRNSMQEVAYWRKANQIRGWFEENVGIDNSAYSKLNIENLEDLLADCYAVLENRNNVPRILDIMPPSEGFFFGSNDIGEHYFDQVERTIEFIKNIIKTTNFEKEEIYYYEWW